MPAIIGAAQGVPLRVIALELVTKNALIVKNNSTIKSVSDLDGKKIGSVKGSGAYFAMVKLLNKAGLDGKYQFVDMQMPSLLPAFAHGDVDGIWIWEPWATRAVADGGRKVADELDMFGAYPGAPIMARTNWLSGQPDAVSRFLAAMFEAQQSYKRDPTTAIQAMANELGISIAMADEIYKQDPKPTFQQEVTVGNPYAIVGPGAAQEKYFQDVGDFFFQNGFVKNCPDMQAAFATTPLADFMKSPTGGRNLKPRPIGGRMLTVTQNLVLPTTITGSYPKPQWHSLDLQGRPFKEAMGHSLFREQYLDVVAAIVADQAAAGLDIVTDGDARFDMAVGGKSWMFYALERLHGLTGRRDLAPNWSSKDFDIRPGHILYEVMEAYQAPVVTDKLRRGPLDTQQSGNQHKSSVSAR